MSKPAPTSKVLEQALGQARGALGTEADVARLRAKLGALPAAAAPPSPPRGVSLGAKIAAGTAAGALVIAGAMMLASRSREPSPERPAAGEVAASPSAPAARANESAPAPRAVVPQPSTAVVPSEPPAPAEPSSAAPQRKRAPAAAVAPVAPKEPPAEAPSELKLLMRAQDAIDKSPQRALALLEEHARFHPQGSFMIERESLAIDALRKLGRETQARERARTFIARFPNAANAKHLARWLDESTERDHKAETQPLPTP